MAAATNYANFGVGRAYNGTNAGIAIELPVPLRGVPTGAYSNLTHFNSSGSSSSISAMNVVNQYHSDYRHFTMDITSTFTSGQAAKMNAENTTSAWISWDAEL